MQEAYAHCTALVRTADKDRYLATLFVPERVRSHVFALYAFNSEIASVRERVKEPLAGAIRLQWWRDVLTGDAAGSATRNPVAAALIDTVDRYWLPRDILAALIDAREFDLHNDAMPTLDAYEAYVRSTTSALFALVARLLAGDDARASKASDATGLAYGTTGLLRAFALHSSRGQIYLPVEVLNQCGVPPSDIVAGKGTPGVRAALAAMRGKAARRLAEARTRLLDVPSVARPAFLPIALVDVYLARMERADYQPFHTRIEVPQWRRQWALWRAAHALKNDAAADPSD